MEMPPSVAAPGPAAPAGGGGGVGQAVDWSSPGVRRCSARPGEVLTRHPWQRTSFTGRLVPDPPGFAEHVGMAAALALGQGHPTTFEIAYAGITLEP